MVRFFIPALDAGLAFWMTGLDASRAGRPGAAKRSPDIASKTNANKDRFTRDFLPKTHQIRRAPP
jgi:hypothetical protein